MKNDSPEKPFVEVEASLEKAGRVEELIRLYEARSREVPSVDEAGHLLAMAGGLARERLKNLPRAEELLRRALVYVPGSREALEGLRALYEQRQDYGSLADVLERLGATVAGQASAAIYLKAADIYEGKLSRRDRAVLCCQLAARAAPQERQAFARARRILLSEARYLPAFESLERERAVVGERDLLEDYLAFAELLVDDPHQHALANRALARALVIDEKNARAHAATKAISKLEETWKDRVRALRNQSLEERDRRTAARLSLQVARLMAFFEPAALGKMKEALDRCFLLWPAMPDALELLEAVAGKSGDYTPAIAVFTKLATDTKDKQAQIDLLVRVGTLQLSRMNNPEAALQAFDRAATIDSSRADAVGLASELLIEMNKPKEGVFLLERHLSTLKEKSAKAMLHLRLADLAIAVLKDDASARKHLEAAYQLEPGNAQAAFRLARVLADAEELELLWPLAELAVSAPRPVNERVAFCEHLAMLFEEEGDTERAFQALSWALPLDPARKGLLETVKASAAASKAEAAFALALRRAVQVAPESAQVSLWRTLAQLSAGPLAKPVEALEQWQQVLKRAPEDAEALAASAAIKKAITEEPTDPRAKLEAEARRLEASAADPAASAAVYRKILELEPDNVGTLKKLGGACASLSQWDEVAVVAERLMALADAPAERQEWRSRLAQLYAERLDRKDEAARLYLNLLEQGAQSATIVGGLERLASQGVRQAEISRALAPHYAKSGDYQRQVASLLVQLSSVQDRDEQKGLLALLADTTEKRLLDVRQAFELRLRGVALDPADSTFRAESVRLAREQQAHAELSRFLSDVASRVAEAPLAASLLEDAAELAEEGGAIEDAAAAHLAALEKSPDDAGILSRLVALYARAKRWPECDQALRRRILLAEGEEKVALFIQLADVNNNLNRPREAAISLTAAIGAGGDEPTLLPKIAAYLEASGRLAELSDVWARLIKIQEKAGDTDAAAALSLKRAKLVETSLGDIAQAISHYAKVLAKKPTDPDSTASLENLLQDAAHREEASRALLPAYEATKDYRKVVHVLAVIAEATKDAGEKLTALKKAGEIHTLHLRQPEQAFASMGQAIRLVPGDAEIRASARASAEEADMLDSYAEILGELLEADVGSAAVSIHRELAEIFEKKLNDQAAAVKHLRALLAIEGKNVDALKSLQRLHRAHEDWPALVSITEQLASIEADSAEKNVLDREAALLSEQKLNDPERAAANWRQIAQRDALAKDAAAALDRLYTQTDRPNELAFALELRRNQEGQSPAGRELAFRLAQLRQARLKDAAGALQLYRQILAEDAAHPGTRDVLEAWARSDAEGSDVAMEALDPVLAQSGDHQRRISLREARFAGATAAERARLSAEIRAILERDLGQTQAAFMSALKAFTDGLDRESVQPELERLARETGSFEELAEIYEETASELDPSDPHQRVLLRRAAELREQLGETDDAVRVWRALLEIEPQDRQALDSLGKLYEKTQNARSLSEVYAKQAAIATDPAARHELLIKSAEAYESAGEDGPAIEAWKAAFVLKRTVQALMALDQLYGRARRFQEQADVLDQLAVGTRDADTRKTFMLRRALLLEKEGQQLEALKGFAAVLEISALDSGAIGGLERLMGLEAVRPEAARLLEPRYRALNDHRKLVEVLDVRLTVADPTQRVTLLNEIAGLREAMGQKPQAFAARVRAFTEIPSDPQGREELERLAADLGAFEELAAAYEDQLDRGSDDHLAEELWRRLAMLYGDRLERPDLAARAWNEVLSRDPKNVFVLDALARLHRKTSSFKELSVVMRRQLGLETNLTAQINLLYELANLAEETLTDKGLAAQCYAEIIERKPEDTNAIRFLGRVLSETERYPELATLIGREVQLAETRGATEEALELMVRLGRLKLTRLGDPRGALSQFQEVLRRKPAHAGAIGALEEMARSDNPLKGEAAATLEPVFAGEGEHLKLVQMLESRVEAEANPQERVSLLRKVAEVYSTQMANPEMAFLAAARALRELPDDERALELVLSLFGPADTHDEMMALLVEVSPRASVDSSRANLYRALARLQAQNDEAEESVESWKRVLELSPTDPEALDQVGRLLGRQGRVPELIEILKRQLAVAEDTNRRATLMFQIGVLQEEQLKDGVGALTTFRRLLELKPDEPAALERMDRLCEAQERWPELADILVRRLKVTQGDVQLQLKYRLGLVRETKLLDKPGALDLYTELLAHDPRHAGALPRMEALVAREPQNLPAVEVLLHAYRAAGDMAKLGHLIEARVSVSPDGFERKLLLIEMAAARDAQEEPELAYLALWRAFKEDPNDAELRRKMESAAEAAKTFDELVGAYEEELPRIADNVDAADVCLKMGQVLEQRLGEPDRAVLYYQKARELMPEAGVKALPALDRLYAQLDQPEAQAEVLDALSNMVREPQEKISLLFRLGQLANERLDSPDRAAAAFERLLELDPKNLPSLRSLELLYDTAKAPDKLYKVLKAQRELVSGADRERILAKMAATSSDGLSDPNHSIDLYRELLSKNPRNEQAFAALDTQLERAKRFDELKELLEGKLKITIDPRELVRLNERMGRVLFVHLGKPEEAIAFFKAALERDARHRGALEALRDIFDTLGRKDDLVIVLRRLIPLQEDATGVKALRVRLAEVLAQGGRREEALDAARRALEVEPHTIPELEKVEAVFLQLKAWPDAVRALELKSTTYLEAEDREAAITTLFKVVDLWREAANKPESAGSALEKILEIDPSSRTAYEQALKQYKQVNDWRAYAQVMDRYLPHLVTEDEKVATLRELAKIQENKLGQKDVAFLQTCRALQLHPQDPEIRDEVERLAEETGSYEELAAVYEEVADALPRGPLAERMYLVLARVHDTQLDDLPAAESALRKILEFDPTNEQALDALAAMFSRRGRDKEYVVALEQKLEAAPSIEKRKEILREISRVFSERLNDSREAEQALQRALELEPDASTLTTLVEIQRKQGDHNGVISTLLRMRDIAPTPEERSRIQVEVAQTYERDLGDDEAAIEGFRQALEFDPANLTALDSLEQLYTKLDRPAELLQVYERQLELTQDYRERVKTLFKSANIWEDRYQNLANADACVDAVLTIDPQNLQAIKTLERLRKAQGRWDELIGIVDRHIQLLINPAEKAELCVEMGDIFHQQLKQVDRAVTAYHQALELDPRCRPAMHALGMLYERSGNWPFALDMLEREAQAAGGTAEAVELYHRMGKINEDMLIDAVSAKRCYLEALKIDPAYLPCIRALKGIYEIEKDFDSYEKALVEEAKQTEEPTAKSRAMLEVARHYADKKEDKENATGYFEEALRLVPDSLEAARPLADIYIAKENWEAGERMLQIVTQQMSQSAAMQPDDPEITRELCRQFYRLGYVGEKLGRKDRALAAFEQAYQLDATYLPALEGLGHLLVHHKRFDDALKVYQTILIHHREDLTDLEIVEIYWTLGDVHFQQKQLDRAENHFEKALAIDPGHEPSLRSQLAISEAAGKWEKAAEYSQRLVQVLDGDARYDVAIALGKLARDKLSDAYMSIDAYLAAHRIKPEQLEVLDGLYVLYRETKQGAKAAEMLEKMLAEPTLRSEPNKAKRVFFALGEINRDELMDLEKAEKAFNQALDVDFRFIEAFSALEAMLGKSKQWKKLDENYKRMIQRLPKSEDTHAARMTLWKALGDLYLKVLKAPEAAVEVYKVVAAGMPENTEIQEAFAELASHQAGYEEAAVEAWRRAMPSTSNPGKIASALAELAARRKDYDSAWLAAQVVTGLIGEGGASEREILTKLGPYAKKKEVASRALTDRLWQSHLFHPKVRGPMSELMAILYEQVGHLFKEDFPRYQINPKRHLVDINGSQEYQIHHFKYVARLLGMETVALYSPFLITTRERMAKKTAEPAPEPNVGIEICHTHPACLKVGGKFFSETGQKEVYYMLGRAMALLRPELALSQRLSAERLEAVFQAALSLSVDRFRFTAAPERLDAERRGLEKALTEQARTALARITKEYVKVATTNDLRNYLEGAELTAVRTGLFVAGEIEPVKKMVLGETGTMFRVQTRSKIRDLMVFALSDDLHALRVAAGVNVEVQLRR
jgi:tetratricopeptide (TPR) repeat protein